MRIILGSGSPRRKDILNNIGLNFEIIPSKFDENLDKRKYNVNEYVMETSKQKGLDIWNTQLNINKYPDLIITADTVVYFNNKILEKPKSVKHAKEMLQLLSNNIHQVSTGVTLIKPNNINNNKSDIHTFCQTTKVHFAELNDQLIDSYLETKESMLITFINIFIIYYYLILINIGIKQVDMVCNQLVECLLKKLMDVISMLLVFHYKNFVKN